MGSSRMLLLPSLADLRPGWVSFADCMGYLRKFLLATRALNGRRQVSRAHSLFLFFRSVKFSGLIVTT